MPDISLTAAEAESLAHRVVEAIVEGADLGLDLSSLSAATLRLVRRSNPLFPGAVTGSRRFTTAWPPLHGRPPRCVELARRRH
jgi:hypothetical protein